jgi:hypothetical protein
MISKNVAMLLLAVPPMCLAQAEDPCETQRNTLEMNDCIAGFRKTLDGALAST